MPDPILVYPAEAEAGLREALTAPARLTLAALATPGPALPPDRLPPGLLQTHATNLGQDDLFYMKSVLVSTGLNRNDDFFERGETWAARKTPEDKPFNYEHDQNDIIGHITACEVLGVDGEIFTGAAEPPDKFHVLTTAVIYRYCGDAARQERAEKLIAEVAGGKWYVSMEALFSGFDYVLVPQAAKAGEYDPARATVVARNAETAFLTKRLRAYGGDGTYNGQKIGRVLRNILFHGKGLVRKPANPESVIFSMSNEPRSGAAAKIEHLPRGAGYGTHNEERPNDMTELETLKAAVADLTAKLQAAQATIAEAKDKNWEKQVEALKADLAAATEKLTKAGDAEAAKAAELASLQKSLDEAKAALAAAETAKADAEAKLAGVEAERTRAERLAKVKAAFDVEDDAEAVELFDSLGLAELSDEKFAKAVDAGSQYMAAKTAAYKGVKPGESDVSDKPKPMGGGSKKVGGTNSGGKPAATTQTTVTKTATAQALDDATPTDTAALAATATEGEGYEQTQADVLAYFGTAGDNK